MHQTVASDDSYTDVAIIMSNPNWFFNPKHTIWTQTYNSCPLLRCTAQSSSRTALSMRNTLRAIYKILSFIVATLKGFFKGNYFDIFYLAQHIPSLITFTCNQYKIINGIFYIPFLVLSLQSSVYFIPTAHLSSEFSCVTCSIATCGRGQYQCIPQF